MNQHKDKSLVSIIIPIFNRAHLIEETLESVIAQTYSNWECIIVDDGSTDGSLDILGAYAQNDHRFFIYERPVHLKKGPNSCRLYGFENSKGDYLLWFDSDDIMEPHKLSTTVNLLSEAKVDCVAHNFNYFRADGYVGKPFNSFGNLTELQELFFSGELILNFQSLLWKKGKIDITYMSPDLSYAEDAYFIGNHLMNPEFKVVIIDEVLAHVRKHEVSLTAEFKNRPDHLIENEVFVRHYFWDILKRQPVKVSLAALRMYLKALKYYLYSKQYKAFYKHMLSIFGSVDFATKFIVLKLIIVSMFYIFTNKGITLYQNIVNTI